jgi:hypothetical protein
MVRPRSSLSGRWRIVSISAWEDDYLNKEVQEFIDLGGIEKLAKG